MDLSATISILETISGLVGAGSTEIRRRSISKTTNMWKVLPVSESHFKTNQKYHVNRKNELPVIDFLFVPNAMYGSIGHRFDARNYFRSRRNRKYWNLITADSSNVSRPVHEAQESTSGRLKPFPVKPEVEIWRKLDKRTRSHRLPIRPQYNVWAYRPPFRR